MVLSLYFFQRVADGPQEIAVGRQDIAPHVEFDHRLRAGDGLDLAGCLGAEALGGSNIGGKLDHFERPAIDIEDGVVGRLYPDFASQLVNPAELAGLELTAFQAFP